MTSCPERVPLHFFLKAALETATAEMRDMEKARHEAMATLVRAALAAPQAALSVAQSTGQTAEKIRDAAAPPSAEALAERMEAAADRMEAAVEAASALRSTDALQVATITPAHAQAPSTSLPPLDASSPFETTPAAAAAAPSNERCARGQCAFCDEPGPFFEGVFGEVFCVVHQAIALSILHDPSNDKNSERTMSSERRVHAAKGGSECALECGNTVTDWRSGSRCASGHALCTGCTSQYVEKTLLPQGTVWWDTIDCVATGCAENMLGMSVQRCLDHAVVARVDAAQLEVIPMIGPDARRERERVAQAARREVDRASEEAIASSTLPCPQCGAPSTKDDGCNYVTCSARWCKHEYCFACGQGWKGHATVLCRQR